MARDSDPLANTYIGDTREPSEADRAAQGVGMAARHVIQATRSGRFPNDNVGGRRSQGETPGAGSMHVAVLSERPNISNARNQGPTGNPSRVGLSTIPIATTSMRHTGRLV